MIQPEVLLHHDEERVWRVGRVHHVMRPDALRTQAGAMGLLKGCSKGMAERVHASIIYLSTPTLDVRENKKCSLFL